MEGHSTKQEKERGEKDTGKVEMAIEVRISEWVTAVGTRASGQLGISAEPHKEQGGWRISTWTPMVRQLPRAWENVSWRLTGAAAGKLKWDHKV